MYQWSSVLLLLDAGRVKELLESVDDKIFERQRGQWAEWEDVD
jgi:hypothetical protein